MWKSTKTYVSFFLFVFSKKRKRVILEYIPWIVTICLFIFLWDFSLKTTSDICCNFFYVKVCLRKSFLYLICCFYFCWKGIFAIEFSRIIFHYLGQSLLINLIINFFIRPYLAVLQLSIDQIFSVQMAIQQFIGAGAAKMMTCIYVLFKSWRNP